MSAMKQIAVLLAALLALNLCSCAALNPAPAVTENQTAPSGSRASIGTPETDDPTEPPTAPQAPGAATPIPAQRFSDDGGTSIDVLREKIGQTTARFGVAYIGCFDPDNGTGIELAQWFSSAASALCAYYPFLSEIDAAHTVGTQGDLYCLLAAEFDAEISVSGADGAVLYRAENGEPFLFFSDTEGTLVTVTAADGTVCQWKAALDEWSYPELLIGDERTLLSYDFTAVPDAEPDFSDRFAQGYLGASAAGIVGTNGMEWRCGAWDGNGQFCLNLMPDGEATLECYYDAEALQAQWQGQWRLKTMPDEPSLLTLELTLTGGADMAAFADAAAISETYWALLHPSGESLQLFAVDSLLPIFAENAQTVELSLLLG